MQESFSVCLFEIKEVSLAERAGISGSVAFERDGVTDCAEGASVILSKGKHIIAKAMTDIFGDFKFGDLEGGSGNIPLTLFSKTLRKKAWT